MYRRPAIESPDGVQFANLSASGSLWKDALIMRDDVSNSMWSQLEGWALKGSERGSRLDTYPFERTTYAAWKARYPNTLVLRKEAGERDQRQSVYADYFSNEGALGIFGTPNPDERYPGKKLVLGFIGQGEQVAIPYDELKRKGWASFELDGKPAICVHDRERQAVRGYLTADGPARVESAGDAHLIVAGDQRFGLDGEPRADGVAALEPLLHTPVFWFAWAQGFPETRVVTP